MQLHTRNEKCPSYKLYALLVNQYSHSEIMDKLNSRPDASVTLYGALHDIHYYYYTVDYLTIDRPN